jgi:hypothetical protein
MKTSGSRSKHDAVFFALFFVLNYAQQKKGERHAKKCVASSAGAAAQVLRPADER